MPCPDHMVSGHAIAQAIHHQPVAVQAWVQSQARPCGFCGGQSETGTGLSLRTVLFPRLFHFINTAHSDICHQHYVILADDSVGSNVFKNILWMLLCV